MSNWGNCKYCGAELVSDSYRLSKRRGFRLIVYCPNEQCDVKPCSNEGIPSDVLEEVKCFGE